MKIIYDEAIILNKREISDTNLILELFLKNKGKIRAICYGIKKSKKREMASYMPLSRVNVEIEETVNGYILKESTLIDRFSLILKNIYKLQISLYILSILSEILEFDAEEKDIYLKNIEILKYIENLESIVFENKTFFYYLLITYLRRIILDLGIFNLEEIIYNEELKIIYIKYSNYLKNKNEIENIEKLLLAFEKYINSYFSININYKKFLI